MNKVLEGTRRYSGFLYLCVPCPKKVLRVLDPLGEYLSTLGTFCTKQPQTWIHS